MHSPSARITSLLLVGLLVIVVFDPSDSLTGLKKYLFLALLVWWLMHRVSGKKAPKIRPAALLIFFLFGFLFPFLSIASYYFQGNDFTDYEGLSTLVGFLSLALLVIISSIQVSAIDIFIKTLTAQAFATLGVAAVLSLNPALISPVTIFGYDQGFLWINAKNYGGLEFLQVFFKTAPFMVLPTAYYASIYFSLSTERTARTVLLLAVCCLALMISGTRANMAFAILIPAYFAFRSLKRAKSSRLVIILVFILSTLAMTVIGIDVIVAMLDPQEESNAVKLGYWNDYVSIFSNPMVLLFGQGIGVVQYFSSLDLDLRITEVTLLELVRNFGIFIAIAYIFFWLAPVFLLKQSRFQHYRWLMVGYISYLLISISNYFILSSTGMILLSIVYSVCLIPMRSSCAHRRVSYVSHKLFIKGLAQRPLPAG